MLKISIVHLALSLLLLLFCISISSASSSLLHLLDQKSFVQCLSSHSSSSYADISDIVYPRNSPSYSSILASSLQNLRFASPATPKPLLIVLPTNELQVRASVICCRDRNLQLRVRSGGHDYEGLSFRSVNNVSFAVIDLRNHRSITVDVERRAAWVDVGATLGELYYKIAEKSSTHGFPAGACPTVGVGGHISGGGFGVMWRKHGLAADNVLDAKLVDANGRLFDRESMGEDLFWAIRGGGGASFGIIVSWKLKLVHVPKIVSVFAIDKIKEEGAIELVNKWQRIAHKLHEDIYLKVNIVTDEAKKAKALFRSFFLGSCEGLLQHMKENFPELGVKGEDCKEMSWIQSKLYFAGYNGDQPLESLMDRDLYPKDYFKCKSDYLKEPIPLRVWEGIWNKFEEDGAGSIWMDPSGGRMSEISESELPYPHRNGSLYLLQYSTDWNIESDSSKKNFDWIRRLYGYMTPYVSKHPRASYVNFRDLDLGMNKEGETSYSRGKVWGEKYYNKNFERLALVKGEIDPGNFFNDEQSIPPKTKGKSKIFYGHEMNFSP